MNSSDVFNAIVWGSGIAIMVTAKMRGRDGRLCLETLYTGLTALAAFGAIDSAVRGENFMSAMIGLVGLGAGICVFEMRSKRKSLSGATAPTDSSEPTTVDR
jgi:hypothetical protein